LLPLCAKIGRWSSHCATGSTVDRVSLHRGAACLPFADGLYFRVEEDPAPARRDDEDLAPVLAGDTYLAICTVISHHQIHVIKY
jgi:hypothetical protein